MKELKLGRLRDSREEGTLMCNAVLYDGNYDCDIKILSDIDMKTINIYEGIYGLFYGVRVEDMLADKISVASGKYVISRIKDLPDIFKIVTTLKDNIDSSLIFDLIHKKDIGDFSTYMKNKEEIAKEIQVLGFNPNEVLSTCSSYINGLESFSHESKKWNGRIWV